MKYHQIDRDLYVKNRAKFTAQMKPNSVAVFNSNDIYPVSAESIIGVKEVPLLLVYQSPPVAYAT